MAWRCGSLSRSLISTVRSSTIRSNPSLRRSQSRRLTSLSDLGTIGGVIGCSQSLFPLHSVVAADRLTSHFAVDARACCDLSQGTFFCRTCPDR